MRKLIVTEFLSLNGVMEAPEKWSFPFWNEEIADFKQEELFDSDCLLLGRVTYEGFAAAWPAMTDEEGFADRMNSLLKYVVSTTLENAEWNNSRLIKDNIQGEIAKLKQQPGKAILIAGSAELIRFLMQHDLIDEYRLLIYPVIVEGKHLFDDRITKNLKLTKSESFGSGVVLLCYEPADEKTD